MGQRVKMMNYSAAPLCSDKQRGIKISALSYLRRKLLGIKPYRFRIVLQVIRVIRVICEICGLECSGEI